MSDQVRAIIAWLIVSFIIFACSIILIAAAAFLVTLSGWKLIVGGAVLLALLSLLAGFALVSR